MTDAQYDIFVSFKALDTEGRPTRESVLAKGIYEFLTARGCKVFYSSVSLEQLGVSAYKKAIDDALDVSRVLVAVGTSAEHLNSQWVRYEWDSFYSDILSGVKPEGRVFVYLEQVELGALPRALRQSQAIIHGDSSLKMLFNFVTNALQHASSSPTNSKSSVAAGTRPRGQLLEEGRQREETKSESVEDIQRQLNSRVLGQEDAIARLTPWIRRLRLGVKRRGRVAAAFLFLGPTGTGKTELAQEIAGFVFRDPRRMVFIEMGQFRSEHSVSGFIGAPPGYVGHGEGLLSKAIRDMPECVVILDEIEKTNTSVFRVVMRFLDEGVVWDPAGTALDGSGCVVVMCTNAGQVWLREELCRHPEAAAVVGQIQKGALDAAVMELKDKGIRPEFLGRIDEVITFIPLSETACRGLIDKELTDLAVRFRQKGIVLSVSDAAQDELARRAYECSVDEGARGARRIVNSCIVSPAIDLATTGEYGGMPLSIAVAVSAKGEITLSARRAEAR